MTLSVYRWEDVHLYFPQKVVEQYRKQIIEEWKSDKFNTDFRRQFNHHN